MARKKREPEPPKEFESEEEKAVESDEDATESSEDDPPTTKEPKDWLRFAFGKDTNHCLWGTEKTGWNHTNSSAAIEAYRNLNLERLYNIALTREGDWIVTGKTKQGAPCVAYWDVKTGTINISEAKAWVKSHEGYQKLFDKLVATECASVDAVSKARFTIGPNGSWWAKLSSGTHHHNLPPNLQTELADEAENNVHPEHVALGVNGSYVVLWPESKVSWELTGYDPLHERIRDREQAIVYVALSPWRNDLYFYVHADGLVLYNVPANVDDIDAYTNTYMQRRAKTDGTTLTYTKSSQSSCCITTCFDLRADMCRWRQCED